MSQLYGRAEIKCLRCKNILGIDGLDIDVEFVANEERQMGAELFYEGSSEFSCPKCGNDIKVIYEASEYPEGSPPEEDISISGAEMSRDFQDADESIQEELYSFEDQSKLSLPEKKVIITNLTLCVSDLINKISKYPEFLYQIEPRVFEELIAGVFSMHGFSVELTKQTRDGGKDIIAIRSDLGIKSKYLIECKRYFRNIPVRVELVRNLYGVQRQSGANKSILATTSYFTPDAIKFAKTKNTTEWAMDLKGYKDIVAWIRGTNLLRRK